MTTEPERLNRTQSGANSERRLIEEVERDICRAFPWLPVDQVSVLVECLWAEYDDALVRDFVPILVRKQAREELRDHFHTEDIDITRTRWVTAPSATNGDPNRDVSIPPSDRQSAGALAPGPSVEVPAHSSIA
jgi:hypothetical protein